MKKIVSFFSYLFQCLQNGFYYICLILSKGFFFFFFLPFYLLEKIFSLTIFHKISNFFREKQTDTVAFSMLVLFFFVGVFLHTYLYVDNNDISYVDNSIVEQIKDDSPKKEEKIDEEVKEKNVKETNLYRKYGSYDLNSISFSQLKEENSDVVAWLMVDGTNINYPIVQTTDNDYYLNHDFLRNLKSSGWTFMDYRNSVDMTDSNTIFYGHNLLNKTAFGSMANIFTEKWFNSSNHYIIVALQDRKYVYQIFSCYYIDPEVYYLQNNFYTDNDYLAFLNTISSRSIYSFGVDVTPRDKIITLSTCTDDNKGRKVVHAKLIEG